MSALRHSPVGDWRLGRMPSIAFAFLVVALHSGTSLADAAKEGTYLYTFTDQAKAIRTATLTGYEKADAPKSNRTIRSADSSEAGTDVSVQVKFYKVLEVDMVKARARRYGSLP